MYSVSNNYLNQIRKPYSRRSLKGTIGVVNFTHDDVLSGSFSVSNQCSDTNEVTIGSVYMGELEATFRADLVPRNQWKGAVITVQDGLYIDVTHSYEYIPLGVYTIDDAKIDKHGIKVHAYDHMIKFEKEWNISTTIGSPYSILRMLCSDCQVGLGMTQAQIEALPNGTQSLALYSENDCETYRDVLFWLAQTLCAFATIGRDGKLYLRTYGQSELDSISTGLRFEDNEFSTYQTGYSGIGLTNVDDKEYIYVSEGQDNLLSYNLGANPFMQYGTKSTRKLMMLNILRQLKLIDYVPFETSLLHCPAYDLGDVIQFTGGIADDTKHCCIMFYEYNFEHYAAEGFGANPALATARNKTDKDIAGLMSKTDKNSLQMYTFKNAESVTVNDNEEQELIYIRFATMEARMVTFQAEILADADATLEEIEAKVKYYFDGAEVLDYQPTETWSEDGKHIINLYYVIDVEPNTLYRWQVALESLGGSITVDQGHARGTIWGQGLVAVGTWDGYIDVEDTLSAISLDSIGVDTFTAEVECEVIVPHDIEVEDTITAVNLDSIEVDTFEAIMYVNKTSLIDEQITWGQLKDDESWADVKDKHVW